jgi:hypothetical protein
MAVFNSPSKVAGLGAKKEKKKETHFRSLPMYIRLRETQRQHQTFPELD